MSEKETEREREEEERVLPRGRIRGSCSAVEVRFEMIPPPLPLFSSRSLASRRYIKKRHQSPVDAIAVRLNRVIKIAGSGVWRTYHPRTPPGDSANNMARCLMSRSITPPCPVFERRTARRRRVHIHVLFSCDDTRRDETRQESRDETEGETRLRRLYRNRRFLVSCIHSACLTLSTCARVALSRAAHQSRAHAIIPLRANDLSVRIPHGPLLRAFVSLLNAPVNIPGKGGGDERATDPDHNAYTH